MKANPLALAAMRANALTSAVESWSHDRIPSLDGANGWLNSPPLTPADLLGKVTVVDFWTYTCINWRRTLPYVRAWANKYQPHGLVVIGVHSPEFVFEKDPENVTNAVRDMDIEYPVAIDSEHAVWRAFKNMYWPALYFVDAEGRIRHHHFGEGEYAQSEMVIMKLLGEAGVDVEREMVTVDADGFEAAADWGDLYSPESYLGYARADNFASPGGVAFDQPNVYTAPKQLELNQWALTGNWTVADEPAQLNEAGGHVTCRFHARDLHLVMGPAERGAPVRFRVRLDGMAPDASAGVDIDIDGNGVASEPRMYQLIRQPGPIVDREFDIEFLDPGAQAFVFTFG